MEAVTTRVADVAERVLADRQFVTAVDVLIGVGWLMQPSADGWLRGHVPYLDRLIFKEPAEIESVLGALQTWGHSRGLQQWQTDYGSRVFTEAGDPATESAFRTRWAAAERPAPRIAPVRPRERKVIAVEPTWCCDECGRRGVLLLRGRKGATTCQDCAGLGHLVFVATGDAALTRLVRKASPRCAVVVRWNSLRYRFDRQGLLADNHAVEVAALQRLSEVTEGHQERAPVDEEFRGVIAAAIRAQFPGCPTPRADGIAYHQALQLRRHSSEEPGADAVTLAVTASVMHVDTDYDEQLRAGVGVEEARAGVAARIDAVLDGWRAGIINLD